MFDWIPQPGWAIPATLLWAGLAVALIVMQARGLMQRGTRPVVILVATGVPVLGLLTHDFGPIWGLAALAAGGAGLKLVQYGRAQKPRDPRLAPHDGPN